MKARSLATPARSEPIADSQIRIPEHAVPRVGPLDRFLLTRVQHGLGPARVRMLLWDGTGAEAPPSPVGALVIRDRATLWHLALDPEVAFGDTYMSGHLELRGDLSTIVEAIYRGLEAREPAGTLQRRALWRRAKSVGSSRADVHHHYDLGNDFYRLWLDQELVYTCAYFPTSDASLEQAQVAKMDHVCRKLRLCPGETVVEAGCGWGSLALHMARHYGVRVTACNLSREQVRYARERAQREGLADRVEFVEDDYRNLSGRFDAFVSIGMLEHVGNGAYARLGDVIHRCLKDGQGRGLLHFIGRNYPRPLNAWIRKRIFPGAYPPTLGEVFRGVLEPWDFAVLDVENLRLHYARTLEHWLQRYEQAAAQVSTMFGETFVRAWRLYLAGSQAAFATGWLQLFQVTFARDADTSAPWTRAELYRGEA